MNTLFYRINEYCKDISMKNFRERSWYWEWAIYRSSKKKDLNTREWAEKVNEWLEIKIKELIRIKKIAEKVLDDFK